MNRLESLFALHLKASGIPFQSEYRLPPRRYRLDFLLADWLAVEIQGGIWMRKGAHNTGLAMLRDMDKVFYFLQAGIVILPVSSRDVESGIALNKVEELLKRPFQRITA